MLLTISPASTRATQYVGDLLRSTESHEVHVLHVLPHVPPFGSQKPGDVGGERFALAVDEDEWRREQEKSIRPMLDDVRALLVRAGVHESFIELRTCAPEPLATVAGTILEKARERDCETIVVGRSEHPWYRRMWRRHVGNALVNTANGRSIWIVE